MRKYRATARRWERGWELWVEGVGVTQSGSLADGRRMVRDYLATELGGEPADYSVEIDHDLNGLELEVQGARRRMLEAQAEVDSAAEEVRRVVRRLRAEGLSVRDVASIVGVSPGRVSQLAGRGVKADSKTRAGRRVA